MIPYKNIKQIQQRYQVTQENHLFFNLTMNYLRIE